VRFRRYRSPHRRLRRSLLIRACLKLKASRSNLATQGEIPRDGGARGHGPVEGASFGSRLVTSRDHSDVVRSASAAASAIPGVGAAQRPSTAAAAAFHSRQQPPASVSTQAPPAAGASSSHSQGATHSHHSGGGGGNGAPPSLAAQKGISTGFP
jgi:hypothetical protein